MIIHEDARNLHFSRDQLEIMPEFFPIAGGKGGVGKSFIAANLGALMAKKGHRVVLVDLDLGASNLHTFLGIKNPKDGLQLFLEKTTSGLQQVALPTHISNLAFISSVDCSMEIANLYHVQKLKLIRALKKLPFDYILLDLGAGTHFNTLDFFLTAEQGVVVITPEPTSIENAFRFIKAAYLRKLKQIVKNNNFHQIIKDAVADFSGPQFKSSDIIDLVVAHDPGREIFLRESIKRFQFSLVLNQFRKHIDVTLGEKIKTVCNRHFYSNFEFLGNIDYDDRVSDTILNKSLFAMQYPEASASFGLREVAERLVMKKTTSLTETMAP